MSTSPKFTRANSIRLRPKNNPLWLSALSSCPEGKHTHPSSSVGQWPYLLCRRRSSWQASVSMVLPSGLYFLHFILSLFLSVQAVGVSVGKNKSQTCRPSAAYIQGSTPPAVLSTGYSTSFFLGWFSTGSSWIILPLFLASAESPLDPWGTHLISSPKGCSASLHQKVAQSWNSLQWMLYIFYNMNRLRIFQIKLWFLFAS